ncbi:hypothetical protein ACVSQB_13135 [Bradyrhizobium elkanii]
MTGKAMPEDTTTQEALDDLLKAFPELGPELEKAGVDLTDEDASAAVLVTANVLTKFVVTHTDELTKRVEALNPRLDRVAEHIKAADDKARTYQLAIAALGGVAVLFSLVTTFPLASRGAEIMLLWLRKLFTSSLIQPAYAATGLSSDAATSSILPVIIYGIYTLLAIGYIGSFFAMIFAPDKKIRSDAFEYLKQITALFIGVASGKLL